MSVFLVFFFSYQILPLLFYHLPYRRKAAEQLTFLSYLKNIELFSESQLFTNYHSHRKIKELLFTPCPATRCAMHRIYADRINSRDMSRVFCDLCSQKTPRGILPVNSSFRYSFLAIFPCPRSWHFSWFCYIKSVTAIPVFSENTMLYSNYSVATVPRGVLAWICQNPETYKPKCHHRRWFTRATSQSPCLHGTLRSAAITIKTRKACFYRLNAFWLVTVKVLNSY